MRRALLLIAGALVVAVIALQAQRFSEASARVDAVARERDAAEARAALALTELEAVGVALEAMTPAPGGEAIPAAEVRALGDRITHEARILRRGDPQLLTPEANEGLLKFFDELL